VEIRRWVRKSDMYGKHLVWVKEELQKQRKEE
jgi:hypothetical protein